MALIQSCLDAVYRWFESAKGTSTVTRQCRVGDLGEMLVGYSISGYEIRLYCQEKHYVREYLSWLFPRQTYSTFRVFGTVSADAPQALKKACELDMDLPQLLPRFLSAAMQKEAAVQAYLDILLSHIAQETGTYPQLR